MPRLRGAIDLGTNSTQLLVACEAGSGFQVVHEWAAVTRLGEGVERTGALQPVAMERTLTTVAGFLTAARERFPGLTGTAGGTSALRDATNRDEFLAACQSRCGFAPAVFSGREEAETTFLGVASGVPDGTPLIDLDVGGGSTEVAAGWPGRCVVAESLNLGCVRFGERFGLLGVSEASSRTAARQAARALLAPALANAQSCLSGEIQVRISGGTATTLSAAVLGLTAYDRDRVEGWETTPDELGEWAERLGGMTLAERSALPCVNEGRALVLPAGLLIVHEALRCLGIDRVQVTTRGLRAGMLVRLSQGTLAACWRV